MNKIPKKRGQLSLDEEEYIIFHYYQLYPLHLVIWMKKNI